MGKGSKQRPLKVNQKTFDDNWDRIFGMHQHKDGHVIQVQETISKFWSDNGKREAIVIKSVKGYSVEFYEKSKIIRTVDMFDKSLKWSEDAAENWCLGLME